MRGIDTGRMPVEGGSWDTATGEDPDEEVIEDTDDTEDTWGRNQVRTEDRGELGSCRVIVILVRLWRGLIPLRRGIVARSWRWIGPVVHGSAGSKRC